MNMKEAFLVGPTAGASEVLREQAKSLTALSENLGKLLENYEPQDTGSGLTFDDLLVMKKLMRGLELSDDAIQQAQMMRGIFVETLKAQLVMTGELHSLKVDIDAVYRIIRARESR